MSLGGLGADRTNATAGRVVVSGTSVGDGSQSPLAIASERTPYKRRFFQEMRAARDYTATLDSIANVNLVNDLDNVLIVNASGGGDYQKLSEAFTALAALSGAASDTSSAPPSTSNRWTVFVYGKTVESAQITAPSFVDVVFAPGASVTTLAVTRTATVLFDTTVDCHWSSLSRTPCIVRVIAVGVSAGLIAGVTASAIQHEGSSACTLSNIVARTTNLSAVSSEVAALFLTGSGSGQATISGCRFEILISSSGSTGNGAVISNRSSGLTRIVGCEIDSDMPIAATSSAMGIQALSTAGTNSLEVSSSTVRGSRSAGGHGVYVANTGAACVFIANNITSYAYGDNTTGLGAAAAYCDGVTGLAMFNGSSLIAMPSTGASGVYNVTTAATAGCTSAFTWDGASATQTINLNNCTLRAIGTRAACFRAEGAVSNAVKPRATVNNCTIQTENNTTQHSVYFNIAGGGAINRFFGNLLLGLRVNYSPVVATASASNWILP
jgi:hypothetical protein